MKRSRTWLLWLAVAVLLGCHGSSSKITRENFEKLRDGMTRVEVVAILGKPSGKETVAEIHGKRTVGDVWQDRRTKIVIAFSPDEKLIVKSIEIE